MNELVQICDLTKVYERKKVAVNHMNLMIPSGRIVGLLGPNGSGKTTLIKMLSGLLVPDQGTIRINGNAPGPVTKAEVSYLPERTYFRESMKVSQLIAYFKDFYAEFRPERAMQMLNNLQIDPNAPLKTLSKGTKEKVQLIMVMSRAARLYLLDEPIGGVDPATRDYILSTIISNYNPDAAVVISTHLIADVEKVLDEVVFIDRGHLVLQSSVDQIREEKGMSVDALFREVFKC